MKVLPVVLMCIAGASVTIAPRPALSQAYPAKPIHVIIPSQPGTLDVYVRMMGPMLQKITGQPWVIEYRAGAGRPRGPIPAGAPAAPACAG
jgi:tripartite-type tricarboxylate transporter receptor subunit TctC